MAQHRQKTQSSTRGRVRHSLRCAAFKGGKHMIDSNIHQHVVARAIKDAAFRQELLSNPKAALAREFNVQVPDRVTIRVLEETPTTLTLVLPPLETGAQELSDA